MSRSSSLVPSSSPLSSIQSSATATLKTATPSGILTNYRPAAPLPFELQTHIHIYLEEILFSQAIDFLSSLVSASTANAAKKIPVASPEILGLIATLTVHPSFTSRAPNAERLNQATSASQLLWVLLKTTGPVNARLNEAFRFRRFDGWNGMRGEPKGQDEDGRNKLRIKYAEEESLFSLVSDFWAVVGWALNCACLRGLYATRWEYWRLWLEYMLDVLERDWAVREATEACEQSLLWKYVSTAAGANVKARYILRAIFADASPKASSEFQAVFPKEMKPPRTDKEQYQKQEVTVDVDEEVYGDYLNDSDTTTDEDDHFDSGRDSLNPRPSKRLRTRTPSARRRNPRTGKSAPADQEDSDSSLNNDATTVHPLGGRRAISIRLRLLQLLTNICAHPDLSKPGFENVFPDPHELFTLFVEFIRPLPLTAFERLILPSGSKELRSETRVALCEFILQRMVDNDNGSNVSTLAPMTQERLVREYLPFTATANTIEFQAKYAVLVEAIVRTLLEEKNSVLARSDELSQAVSEGTAAREKKAAELAEGASYKKSINTEEEYALQVVEESGARMRYLVEDLLD